MIMLTPREQEITQLVARGMASKNIAHELSICEGTVKVHLKNAYRKTGQLNRTLLAVWWRSKSDNLHKSE